MSSLRIALNYYCEVYTVIFRCVLRLFVLWNNNDDMNFDDDDDDDDDDYCYCM